jgi:hypothetical protein
MKKLVLISACLILLTATILVDIHLGTRKAEAQTWPQIAGYSVQVTDTPVKDKVYRMFVITVDGRVFTRTYDTLYHQWTLWEDCGIFWEDAISANKASWGELKGSYKK